MNSRQPGAGGLFGATVKTAVGYLWRLKYYLAAVAGAVVAVVVVAQKASELGQYAWVAGVIGFLPLAAAFVFEALPEWRSRRRARKLEDWQVIERQIKPGFFRIGPYEETQRDRDDFDRADKAHEAVCAWLQQSTLPVVFLTGGSGTGKTSLLSAYVIPRLRESTPPVRTITLRSFDDPMAALRTELVTPGVIWSEPRRPLENLDVLPLLRKACEYLAGKGERLLVVFDQFEELVIIHDRTPERVEAAKQFLRSIQDDPLPGLTTLLALRTDYEGMLGPLGLPLLEQGRNWLKLSPFTFSAATQFLKRSGLEFGPKRLQAILDEAAAFEEAPGVVRPITLNMLGNLVQRMPGQLDSKYEPGSLLITDVRNCLERGLVKDQASDILERMLTQSGTKQPRSVGDLARETGITPDAVEGCLLQLNGWGLVRRISRAAEVAERIWEISHDFLAQLIARVLATRKRSLWQRTRPILAPASVALWILAFALAIPTYLQGVPGRAADELRVRFRMQALPTPDGWELQLRDRDDITTLSEIGPLLNKLGRIRSLDLSGCKAWTDMDGLQGLTQLETLDLSDCPALTNVDGLKGVMQLQNLKLCYCSRLTNVDGLQPLTQLRTLNLMGCVDLRSLDFLRGLTELQTLNLALWPALTNLDGLEGLTQLQTLNLHSCHALTNVDGLKGLTQLQTLALNGCPALTDVDVLKGLTQLQRLDLSDCVVLMNVDGLKGLTQLQRLGLSDCFSLTNVDGLKGLTQLRSLDLSRCDALSNVDGLKGLTQLQTLDLRDCTALTNVDGLQGLTQLQTLRLSGCTALTNVDGLKGLRNLRILYLTNTPITDAVVKRLQNGLPGVTIVR